MKRYQNLYPQITDFANLYSAWRKAARGKRGKQAAASFEMLLEDELVTLQRQLQAQTWQPGQYHSFMIRDPKLRLISAAPFRDRVVHHALCNIIDPLFERTFIGDSYANRKGKGTHAALDKAQQFSRRYRYVLQCDIVQFFPSIDHDVLYQLLAGKINDDKTLWLIRQIIKSSHQVYPNIECIHLSHINDPDKTMIGRGLPLGNLTSQFWANVYMNALDQYVKRQLRCPAYLRYVDDYLLFSDDKKQLWQWKNNIHEYLKTLHLQMHEKPSTVYPCVQGIPFLGLRLYPDYRRLKRRNGVNFARRLSRYYRSHQRGEMALPELTNKVAGWVAHVEHANTWGLRKSLLSSPFRLKNKR
jgi:retron-type reverse transcriptase